MSIDIELIRKHHAIAEAGTWLGTGNARHIHEQRGQLLAEVDRLTGEVAALRVLAPILPGDRVRVTGRYPFVVQDIEACEGTAAHVDEDGSVLVAFEPAPKSALGGRITHMRVHRNQLQRQADDARRS